MGAGYMDIKIFSAGNVSFYNNIVPDLYY